MSSSIIIDYYEGAYGPTIRIDTINLEDIVRIKNIFTNLKNKILQEINLKDIDNIQITGFYNLIIRIIPKRSYFRKQTNITKKFSLSNKLYYIWALTVDACEHCEGLIEGIIMKNSFGHQYLTRAEDGIIIEIAYREARPIPCM